jgi:hypothetical protein
MLHVETEVVVRQPGCEAVCFEMLGESAEVGGPLILHH